MKTLLDLFLTFAKIGLFTFGGGYAMIPMIEDNCVERKKWITHDEMMNMTVIAESTPGPIAVNAATFVGFKQKGLPGALFATVGITLPSFVIIYVISMFFDDFLEIGIIAKAFMGIKIAVGILILNAGINMLTKTKKKALPVAIVIVSFTVMMLVNIFAVNFSSVILLLTAATVGFVFFLAGEMSKKKGGGSK